MSLPKTPVMLADQLCQVVLDIRTFGDINSPYLTRLENEVRKSWSGMSRKRVNTIRKEISIRRNQLDSLIDRLRQALKDFGPVTPSEMQVMNQYWEVLENVKTLCEARMRDVMAMLPTAMTTTFAPEPGVQLPRRTGRVKRY